ncbi:MAG TPA: 16S rRNA (uracil(1498)-N(3))-methyltransferase [Candidatus Saccharimonadia bacterium]|nr:16S rRNA (uracil(1498)-N(3))-methyltransferase [Candidatus Saccharimonadia bacterium]
MRRIRVYVDAPLATGAHVVLPPFSSEHLTRVLRLPDGAEVVCFNGDGADHAAILELRGKGAAALRIGARSAAMLESPLAVTLVQAVARGEKMDLILQKSTELGVARFVPVISERTEVRLDDERAEKRVAHWQRIVQSACEQCGRARVPMVEVPVPLARYAEGAMLDTATKLVLHPSGDALGAVAPGAALTLAVGPEGGFSERDLSIFTTAGFGRLRLGPRILRTETAGIAAIAALQTRFGDLG